MSRHIQCWLGQVTANDQFFKFSPIRHIFSHLVSLTCFMPLISFCNPPYIRKPEVLWCFQGVCKEISGIKQIKEMLICLFLGSWNLYVNNIVKSIQAGLDLQANSNFNVYSVLVLNNLFSYHFQWSCEPHKTETHKFLWVRARHKRFRKPDNTGIVTQLMS